MTRIEEIRKEAKLKRHDIANEVDYKSSAAYDGFVMGAQWADKTMIEKIRNWVTERYDLDFMGDFKDLLDYLKSLQEE